MSKLFSPLRINNLTLKNRIVMAPMQQYQGTKEAYATDYHVDHYAKRARGGVGLVIIESTSVAAGGRLFQNDIGIFSDHHIKPLTKVVEAVHGYDTPVFIQLCHGGRKSSPENREPMLAPSEIAFDDEYGLPNEMVQEDIQEVIGQFADAARRSVKAGFDGIELHAAHGYLIHQFLSPLSNRRKDKYGGDLENRLRFLQETLIAVRQEVGSDYPVQIRFSASDYREGGLTPEEVGEMVQLLQPYGIDAIHVSTGGLLPIRPPEVIPGYQVPVAEKIKAYSPLPVMAVGLIHTKELAEEILAADKADFIAIGRPLLENPYFAEEWGKQ